MLQLVDIKKTVFLGKMQFMPSRALTFLSGRVNLLSFLGIPAAGRAQYQEDWHSPCHQRIQAGIKSATGSPKEPAAVVLAGHLRRCRGHQKMEAKGMPFSDAKASTLPPGMLLIVSSGSSPKVWKAISASSFQMVM